MPGRVVGQRHARRSSCRPCLRSQLRARVVTDLRTRVVDDCRPVGADDHEAVAARGDDTEFDRPECEPARRLGVARGGRHRHDLTVDRDQLDGVVADDCRSDRRGGARRDCSSIVVEDVDGGIRSDVLRGDHHVVVDGERQPREVRGLISIEREQHTLEVARVGDQDVAARCATAGAAPFVPGARDRIERIGVDHVAARSVDDQPSSCIGVGSDHREAATRWPRDGVGADGVFRRRLAGKVDDARCGGRHDDSGGVDDCTVEHGPDAGVDASKLVALFVVDDHAARSLVDQHDSIPLCADRSRRPVTVGAVGQIGDHERSRGDHCHDSADHDPAPDPVVRTRPSGDGAVVVDGVDGRVTLVVERRRWRRHRCGSYAH